MSTVHVVVEDAGYDVGRIVRGVFSTAQKADEWIAAKAAERADEVRKGNAARWGAPSYDIEEHQLDPAVGDLHKAP
ncbi:hypothetical protein [Streptomyces sp. NPDC047990]|uniref:hypothetical protein n=1 Tax=Streptomyces sp. NPDC047990 TaxID=3365496 RepID=UPI0037241CA6